MNKVLRLMEQESHLQICVTNRGGQGGGMTFEL